MSRKFQSTEERDQWMVDHQWTADFFEFWTTFRSHGKLKFMLRAVPLFVCIGIVMTGCFYVNREFRESPWYLKCIPMAFSLFWVFSKNRYDWRCFERQYKIATEKFGGSLENSRHCCPNPCPPRGER